MTNDHDVSPEVAEAAHELYLELARLGPALRAAHLAVFETAEEEIAAGNPTEVHRYLTAVIHELVEDERDPLAVRALTAAFRLLRATLVQAITSYEGRGYEEP